MKRVNKIIDKGLCLGCGLCEAIAGREKCQMIINSNGFYRPLFKTELNKHEIEQILKCCPGINVEGYKNSGVWGNMLLCTESWSADGSIRKKSGTGGVITSLAIYLLESNKVNAILHVGLKKDSWLYNELSISRTREDVISNSQSRYAPALIFDKIKHLLDESEEIFGFIGKPCDIAGIKSFIKYNPQYEGRIKYTLAIFCAGMPSYNASKYLIAQAGIKEEPYFLKYRGDGWPGNFETRWGSGKSFKVSYNDSWGKVLGKTLGIRCKICPDGIGMLADISTGDSWNTKNGYPDFTEADGKNFCFIRSSDGKQIYFDAVKSGNIISNEFDRKKVKSIHQYQYSRRISVGWRILAIQLITFGLLKFKKMGLISMVLYINPIIAAKEFFGTLRRTITYKDSIGIFENQYNESKD